MPVTAFDRTKTIVLDTGVFSTLDNQVDTTTGTVRAKARFANTQGKLFPNQFVNVRVSLQTLKNAVVVPVTAVRTGADGDFVWKLKPDKTVTMGRVVRGPATATTTSILQGLAAGEKVITEGGDRLTEGARVQLPGDKPGVGGARGAGHHRRGGQAGAAGGPPAAAPRLGAAVRRHARRLAAADPRRRCRPRAKRLAQACAVDAKTLCAGQEGREMSACLRQNADKLSASCKAAMAKHAPPAAAGRRLKARWRPVSSG